MPSLKRSLMISVAVALAIGFAWEPGQARADGDPASDVLLTQPLFLPFDAGVSDRQQAELASLMQAAGRSGYRLRVAVIASPTDLGSVTALWRQPESYAEYLGEELQLAYRGTVLVIMPDGFGLYRSQRPIGGLGDALSTIGVSGGRAGLGMAAVEAIERLAAAAGHRLSASSAVPTAPSARPSNAESVEWMAFAFGVVLIAVAWGASLWVRPVRLRHRIPHRAG